MPGDTGLETMSTTDVIESSPTSAGRARRWLRSMAVPTAVAAGGVGVLGVVRSLLHRRLLFRPEKFPVGTWLPADAGLEASDVWFEAEDGVRLHGWWIPHPDPVATVLYCHGQSGNIARQASALRDFSRLRVNALAFDYRGYGRSGGSPSETGIYRDARAAYRHLVDERGEPAGRIVLFGHSLGGAVAIDAALDCDAAGLIIQSSFTHLRDAARSTVARAPLHYAARRQFRSIEKVEQLTLPKLFVHGEVDEVLPHEYTRQLFERAADPKQLLIVPCAGHRDVHLRGGERYRGALSEFIRNSVSASDRG